MRRTTMRKRAIVAVLTAGLAIGTVAPVYAKLPPAPAKTDAEKAADAAKAAAAKAKAAEEQTKAEDRAVANYRKNKGIADPKAAPAAKSGKKK